MSETAVLQMYEWNSSDKYLIFLAESVHMALSVNVYTQRRQVSRTLSDSDIADGKKGLTHPAMQHEPMFTL